MAAVGLLTLPNELLSKIQDLAGSPFLHQTCHNLMIVFGLNQRNHSRVTRHLLQKLPDTTEALEQGISPTYEKDFTQIINQEWFMDILQSVVTTQELREWSCTRVGRRVIFCPPKWTRKHGKFFCFLRKTISREMWVEIKEWKTEMRFEGLLRAFDQGSNPAVIPLLTDLQYEYWPTTSRGRPVWEELELVDEDHQNKEAPPDPRSEYMWSDFRPDELDLGQTGGRLLWWIGISRYQMMKAAIMNVEKCPKVVKWILDERLGEFLDEHDGNFSDKIFVKDEPEHTCLYAHLPELGQLETIMRLAAWKSLTAPSFADYQSRIVTLLTGFSERLQTGHQWPRSAGPYAEWLAARDREIDILLDIDRLCSEDRSHFLCPLPLLHEDLHIALKSWAWIDHYPNSIHMFETTDGKIEWSQKQ